MSRSDYVMTCTEPHPDHFDASKFGPDGQPVGRAHGKLGKRSRLRPEDVEQLLFLEKLRNATERDFLEFLAARGFKTKRARLAILQRLHGGWRPTR